MFGVVVAIFVVVEVVAGAKEVVTPMFGVVVPTFGVADVVVVINGVLTS